MDTLLNNFENYWKVVRYMLSHDVVVARDAVRVQYEYEYEYEYLLLCDNTCCRLIKTQNIGHQRSALYSIRID